MYGKKSMVSKTAYKIAQKIRVEQYYTDIVESDSDDFKKILENINTTKQVTDEIKNKTGADCSISLKLRFQ